MAKKNGKYNQVLTKLAKELGVSKSKLKKAISGRGHGRRKIPLENLEHTPVNQLRKLL